MADNNFISQIKIGDNVYKLRDSEMDELRNFLNELSTAGGPNSTSIGVNFDFANGVRSHGEEVINKISIDGNDSGIIELGKGESPYFKLVKDKETGTVTFQLGLPPFRIANGDTKASLQTTVASVKEKNSTLKTEMEES